MTSKFTIARSSWLQMRAQSGFAFYVPNKTASKTPCSERKTSRQRSGKLLRVFWLPLSGKVYRRSKSRHIIYGGIVHITDFLFRSSEELRIMRSHTHTHTCWRQSWAVFWVCAFRRLVSFSVCQMPPQRAVSKRCELLVSAKKKQFPKPRTESKVPRFCLVWSLRTRSKENWTHSDQVKRTRFMK